VIVVGDLPKSIQGLLKIGFERPWQVYIQMYFSAECKVKGRVLLTLSYASFNILTAFMRLVGIIILTI
jgi:hypothetical protein